MTDPRLNSRGHPCTSVGRRNAASIGSGRGNGGVLPPQYERRRDSVGDDRHSKMWRRWWLRVIGHLRDRGDLSVVDFAVLSALADFSSESGSHVWPSQATIGLRIGRSASTVNRSLCRARELRVVNWDHRFEGPTNEYRGVKGTSNLYEFLIPEDLATEMNIGQRRPRRERPDRTTRHDRSPSPTPGYAPGLEWQRHIDSHVAAVVLSAATYQMAEAEVEDAFQDRDVQQRTYAASVLNERWQQSRAGPSPGPAG